MASGSGADGAPKGPGRTQTCPEEANFCHLGTGKLSLAAFET